MGGDRWEEGVAQAVVKQELVEAELRKRWWVTRSAANTPALAPVLYEDRMEVESEGAVRAIGQGVRCRKWAAFPSVTHTHARARARSPAL